MRKSSLLIVRTSKFSLPNFLIRASIWRYTEFPANSKIYLGNYNRHVYSYRRHSPGLTSVTIQILRSAQRRWLTFWHWSSVTPYTSSYEFAGSCVFDKQSPEILSLRPAPFSPLCSFANKIREIGGPAPETNPWWGQRPRYARWLRLFFLTIQRFGFFPLAYSAEWFTSVRHPT